MKNENLEKARIIGMQLLMETFLLTTEQKSAKQYFANEDFKYGEISDAQGEVLRNYLRTEFAALGLNLDEEVAKAGETMTPGEFSRFETKELVRRADQMVISSGIVRALDAALKDRKDS